MYLILGQGLLTRVYFVFDVDVDVDADADTDADVDVDVGEDRNQDGVNLRGCWRRVSRYWC